MDFALTGRDLTFRQEVREFLQQELPPDWKGPWILGGFFETPELAAAHRIMAKKLAARGWLRLRWPEVYGGQPAFYMQQLIFAEEMAYHRAPGLGAMLIAQILLAFGTDEQKKRHLGPIGQGELNWCQGFSEPDAGSDLASLKTRALKQGNGFVVTGQKVWTTGAHFADWMFLLARTDPNLPKRKGISFFLLDLKSPGVTVRPLPNVIGVGHHTCEVFFDRVWIPLENLVGGENNGWELATSLLGLERSGIHYVAMVRRELEDIVSYIRESSYLRNETLVRQKLAELWLEAEVARCLAYRVAWMQDRGQDAEAQASISKVFGTELMQRVDRLGMETLGLYSQLLEGSARAVFDGNVAAAYVGNLGRTIAAGTSEIQRNIIAWRRLGLPR